MTRLFGCICNDPEHLEQALVPVQSALVAEAPIARWGLGYVQGGEILLSRNPRLQTSDVDFCTSIQDLRTDYIIAHARAPDTLSGNANTQPYRYRYWMFAQEGDIDAIDSLQEGLQEQVPDFLRRNIKGKALSEYVFHLLLASLYKSGNIDDVNLDPRASFAAVTEALAQTRTVIADTGAARKLGNLMFSNGRSFVAVRLDKPMYLRRLTVPDPKGNPEAAAFRGILITSTTSPPGEGFEIIPDQSALLISRDLHTDIAALTPV